MDARIVSAGGCQNVVVRRRVGNVIADIREMPIHVHQTRSIYQTIDERSVWVLENGLDRPLNNGWLSPIVILKRDYENMFDFPVIPVILGPCTTTAHRGQECEHT